MAALILAIIACVAPSAVQAHEGHIHCAHHGRAVAEAPTASPSAVNLSGNMPSRIATVPVAPGVVLHLRVTAGQSSASVRAADADRGCCPGACKRRCCGTMVCCVFVIGDGPASLAVPVSRGAVLIPHNAAGPVGIGPDGLRKPPRTLA